MIKKGVKAKGLQPEILLAIMEAREVYRDLKADLVITDLGRRTNKASLHYEGLAVDIRIRHLANGEPGIAAQRLHVALGPDFDVVLEKDHIHIEFQPKD